MIQGFRLSLSAYTEIDSSNHLLSGVFFSQVLDNERDSRLEHFCLVEIYTNGGKRETKWNVSVENELAHIELVIFATLCETCHKVG